LVGQHSAQVAYHLSAGMCVAHRNKVLKAVRAKLRTSEPIKVIATQVVEAGVDIDFPRVMRALAGLDSLIQSAGRCNRHGLRPWGAFEVFNPAGEIPRVFQDATTLTVSMLRQGLGLFDPATANQFYTRLRDGQNTDRPGVIKALDDGDYTRAGRRFRLIEATESVVVSYGSGGLEVIEKLHRRAAGEQIPDLFDGLQFYSVNVPPTTAKKLEAVGMVTRLEQFGLYVADPRAYDDEMGLLGADDFASADDDGF
jgi:CRISPR-associated endonuclease/helicase Cas3